MIVVLGDVMCDVYVDGSVHRISPDAPVPVLLCSNTSRRASGACLAAGAAAGSGVDVALIGVVGDDLCGSFLTAQVGTKLVRPMLGVVPGCPTITKTRFRASDHHLLRVDEDGSFAGRSSEVHDHIVAAWTRVRAAASAVLVSDYAKGTLDDAVIRQIIEDANADGIRVVVDSKRRDLSPFHGASAWTPNLVELTTSGVVDDESGWRDLCDRLCLEALIVTRAGDGATVVLSAGLVQQVHPPPVAKVRSVAGAGDILAGVVTALVGRGASWLEAASEGVEAATAFVTCDPTTSHGLPQAGDT